MGNSSSSQKAKVPTVEVTYCTLHDYLAARIKTHGSKVAQVDAATGEEVTFDAILERAAALAAGLTARGLRAGEAAIIIGENSVHYPWVLLGVLQTGASAHLIDPRSTPREVQHALSISKPTAALVSRSVSHQPGVAAVLRGSTSVTNVLVWGDCPPGQDKANKDLPNGIAPLEQMLISPAKSASSVPCSPSGAPSVQDATTPDVQVLSVMDVGPGRSVATTPSAPPPTPTSLGAVYGDSCSPSSVSSPMQKFLVHAVDGLPQPQGGSAVALILPSSGSTGLPKGVMITHDNVLAALNLGDKFIQADDVVAGVSPYFHAFGGLLMLMSLCAGVPVVALGRFSMAALLDAVKKHKITVLHVVSSLLVSFSKHPVEELAKFKSLRRIWSGAAQISPLVQSALQSRLPNVKLFHSYGMTETTFTTFCGEVRADKPGSPGPLVGCMECKVVDTDTGKAVAMGSRGELCFKGSMVMRGYLNNADATNEAFDADGWLRSGDLGFVDEDGYFYVVERLKDVLKYNGHQVSPSELEALLITHPAVSEAAVVGVPHEYGDAPRALVMLAEGHHVSAEDLQEFIQGKVAPHKQLRGGIVFVTSPFPRTASGKLQRKKLNAMLGTDADDSMTSSSGAGSMGEPSVPNSPTPEAADAPEAPLAAPEPEPEHPKEAPRTQQQPQQPQQGPEQSEQPANGPAPVDLKKLDSKCVPEPESLTVSYAKVAAMPPPPRAADEDVTEVMGKDSTPIRLQTQTSTESTGDAQAEGSEPQSVVSPEFMPHRGPRPSVVSTTSLSTIYSESPLDSPNSIVFPSDSAFMSPSLVALKEAAKIPLPPSEPTSFSSEVFEGSLGSCNMDMTSPLASLIKQDESQNSPSIA